jgi:hypothetical protein
MRILLATLSAGGLALIAAGAVSPGLFVLSLLGMLVLTGTAVVGLAAVMQSTGPQAHF